MVVDPCEYTKNHWTIHVKWVNHVAYELYLNQAAKKVSGNMRMHTEKSFLPYTALENL